MIDKQKIIQTQLAYATEKFAEFRSILGGVLALAESTGLNATVAELSMDSKLIDINTHLRNAKIGLDR